MAGLGDLVIKMSLDTASFSVDASRAATTAENAAHQIGVAIGSSIRAFGLMAVAAGAATTAAAAFLSKVAVGVQEQVDALDSAAASAGIASDKFQKLQAAFEITGVSAQTFNVMLSALNVNMTKAAEGNAKAAGAFERLGISVTDASGNMKTADVVLGEINDKFREMPDGPEKARLAVELLGRSGAQAISALNGDLDALGQTAEDVGAIFDTKLIAASREFATAQALLGQEIQGVRNIIASGFLPVLSATANTIFELTKNFLGLENRTKAIEVVQELATVSFRNFLYVIGKTIDTFITLKDIVVSVAEALTLIPIAMIQAGEAAQKFLNLDFSGAKQSLATIADEVDRFKERVKQRLEREPVTTKIMFEFDKQLQQGVVDRLKKEAEVAAERAAISAGGGAAPPARKQERAAGKVKDKAARELEQAEKRLLQLEERNAREGVEIQRRASQAELKIYLDGLTEEEKASKRLAALEAKNKEDATAKAQEESQKQLDIFLDGLEKAEAESRKFQEIFTNNVGDALADVVTGAKSVGDAFQDMAKSITNAITRIVAQDIADSIFGTRRGGGGGIGDFFASLLGGGGKTPAPFMGGGGIPAAFADGGTFQANRMIMVGERGPEMIYTGNTSGRVVPINNNQSSTNNIVINMPQNSDRRTADQVASSVGIAVQRAMKRNQ